MVEFALVFPIFLTVTLSSINGGLLLWASTQLDHANEVGCIRDAEKGNYYSSTTNNADTSAYAAMSARGLTDNSIVTIAEIDVIKQVVGANGTLTDSTTSVNKYHGDGSLISEGWPASGRSVTLGSTDTAKMVIKYTFHFIGLPGPAINVSSTRVFELEPLQP